MQANRLVGKTVASRVFGTVDAAQIDQDGLLHHAPEHAEPAGLFPFRHDNERIGPLRALISILAVGNIRKEWETMNTESGKLPRALCYKLKSGRNSHQR